MARRLLGRRDRRIDVERHVQPALVDANPRHANALFLHGAWLTIQLSVIATLLGFLIGTLCAFGRGSHNPWVARTCSLYVEIIRNTPLLVQIFIVYFGLSSLGWKVPAYAAAIAALVINIGAYTTEIMRAATQAKLAEVVGRIVVVRRGARDAGEARVTIDAEPVVAVIVESSVAESVTLPASMPGCGYPAVRGSTAPSCPGATGSAW